MIFWALLYIGKSSHVRIFDSLMERAEYLLFRELAVDHITISLFPHGELTPQRSLTYIAILAFFKPAG